MKNARLARRSIVGFIGPFVAAAAGAALLALGLPKASVPPLAFVGLALLFWAWFGLSPGRAFLAGWFSGLLYFAATFSWFAQTAGQYIAPYGFALVLFPAILEGFAFAVAGALCAFANRRAAPHVAPLAAAAAFAAAEWLRSSGPLALPFGNVSYPYAATPLGPIAAYCGSFGLTFAIALAAAYIAQWAHNAGSPRVGRGAVIACVAVVAVAVVAWAAWPARRAAPATVRVAAIQGNIPQDVKWTRAAFLLALERYEALTRRAAASRPALILWPETVVTIDLNLSQPTIARIGALARSVHAEVIVGAKQLTARGEYNALYFFDANGRLAAIYQKRRLVPFVEQLPAPWLLGNLPMASLVSRFVSGEWTGVREVAGLRVAPLICWESAFDGAAHEAAADGAQAFLVATDDAWFGETAGPYQHAEIAQMRALETGSWIVRAAATGVSGIISPDGRYVERAPLDRVAVVTGTIGPPAATPYARLGALWIGLCLIAVYAATLVWGARR